MPRTMAPPSPELSSSFDCAFPPFPQPAPSRSQTPTSGSRPSTRNGHREERGPSRLGKAETNHMYAPLSPRVNGGESIVKRMDTIKPGPFEARSIGMESRPKTPSKDADGGIGRAATVAGWKERSQSRLSQGSSKGHGRSYSVASSHASQSSTHSVGLPAGPKSGMRPPPRPARPEGVDAFLKELQTQDRPRTAPNGSEVRSNTFPIRKASKQATEEIPPLPTQRRPSAPQTVLGPSVGLSTSPPNDTFEEIAPKKRAPPNPFSTRKPSRTGEERPDLRLERTQPMQSNDGYLKSPDNTLHTPSDSASSDGSMSSFDAQTTSSISSTGGSDFVGIDAFLEAKRNEPAQRRGRNEPRAPMSEPKSPERRREASRPREDSSQVNGLNAPMGMSMNFPTRAKDVFHGNSTSSPPNNRSPPRHQRTDPLPPPPAPPAAALSFEAPESPMDPAIQRGLISQRRPSASNKSPPRPTQIRNDIPPIPPAPKFPEIAPALKVPDSTPSAEAVLARKPTTGNKGKCRGCQQPIVGKSVKAADGRLTGRWHKQCK
jgi:hypothetical protein